MKSKRWFVMMVAFVELLAVVGTVQADWLEQDKLLASTATSSGFGGRVSISGDYAIVGARGSYGYAGAAYFFKRDGTDWTEQQMMIGSGNDMLGRGVDISGDYAIVAAHWDGESTPGYVKIYKRDGETWIEQAHLTCPDGAPDGYFGCSAAIDPNYAIVGAYAYYSGGNGSAYIYKRDGETWTYQVKLTASDGASQDGFGLRVSIKGDYAIVGAYRNDDNGSDSGSAYIFKRDGESWAQQAKLTASDGAAGDYFGLPVRIDGDYAIMGAYSNDDNGSDSGSAYIFKRDGENWAQQAKLTASDGAEGDYFGDSVSLSGNYAIVAARHDDDKGTNSGSAYIFKRDGTSWTELTKLTASDGAASDYFSCSVSISGDYCIAAAFGDDDIVTYSGSAYIFKRECPVSDLTADCRVDFSDFSIMAGEWLQDN